jgi:ABC-type branched-subunit amino acid transport system substrate-binding protein
MRSAGGLMLLALMVAVAEAQDRAPCPPAEVFPRADWAAGANCTVITFAGSISTATPVQNPLWVEGLRMYANFTNGQGGLRLGKGHIGYVEIQITDLASSYYPNPTAKDHYEGLCKDDSVDVLLGPISSNVARDVLVDLKSNTCPKPFVVADTSEQLFQLDADTLWSVEGWNATQKGDAPIKFLHTLGARTYAIVTQGTAAYEDMANALRNAIYSYTDTRLLDSVKWTGGVSMINELAIELESKVPDAFIGVGDLDMFESLLNEFKGQKYGPKAAFFMEGLAASAYMQQESYLTKGCSRCVVYNQWMGTVPWSEQMPYYGRNNWTAIQEGDPYGDRGSGSSADRRNQRYIGSAADFGKLARTWLSAAHSRLSQPDAYHAKAFASLLMLQMALELAPDGNGGLALEKLRQPQEMRKAKVALDVNTFWGRIKLRRDGFNEGFRMGIAQFQKHDPVPNLVGPAASFSSTTAEALYPAVWPCNLYDTCDITEGWSLWEVLGALLLGAVGVLVSIGCYLKVRSGPGGLMGTLRQISFLSRESLYNTTTDHLLAEAGVSATWYTAANAGDSALDPAPDGVPPGIMVDTGDTRMLKHQRSPAPVLFRDQHIGDLRPKTWRDQRIGKGSYGTVYRATWKGKDVAVKELKVPEEPSDLSSREKEVFIQQAKDLRDEFLKELKVSCDCACCCCPSPAAALRVPFRLSCCFVCSSMC